MLLNPSGTALVAIDCQRVFMSGAHEGSEDTERAARAIGAALPGMIANDIPLWSVFSRAARAGEAGLIPPVASPRTLRKTHESACVGSDLLRRLSDAQRTTVILFGVHTTICVKASAIHAAQAGYKVLVPIDMIGEGSLRRRHGNSAVVRQNQIDGAFQAMRNSGVILTTSANLKFMGP